MEREIITCDDMGGDYIDSTPGGRLGFRRYADRRFWMAWKDIGTRLEEDILHGVMDDFGTLVDVPK